MTASDMPVMVVVIGPPAAGKTRVARALAGRLRLPLTQPFDLEAVVRLTAADP